MLKCLVVLLRGKLYVAMLHSGRAWIDLVLRARKRALYWLVCRITFRPTSFTLTRLNLKRAHGTLVDSHFKNGAKGDKSSTAKFAITLHLFAIEPNDALHLVNLGHAALNVARIVHAKSLWKCEEGWKEPTVSWLTVSVHKTKNEVEICQLRMGSYEWSATNDHRCFSSSVIPKVQ